MYWYTLAAWCGEDIEQVIPRLLPGTNSVQFFQAINMITRIMSEEV